MYIYMCVCVYIYIRSNQDTEGEREKTCFIYTYLKPAFRLKYMSTFSFKFFYLASWTSHMAQW